MSKLHSYVSDIYKLAEENPIEVYKKYFTDETVTIDLDGSETKGVQNHIDAITKWMEGAGDMYKNELVGYTVSGDENDGTVISIWDLDFEHSEMGRMTYKQSSVTKWKDGKVIHEQFFGDYGEES